MFGDGLTVVLWSAERIPNRSRGISRTHLDDALVPEGGFPSASEGMRVNGTFDALVCVPRRPKSSMAARSIIPASLIAHKS